MKLKDYIKNLNEIVKEFPEALEMDVYYSSDSEGNYFNKVFYSPSLNYIDENDEILAEDDWEEYGVTYPNSVVIN